MEPLWEALYEAGADVVLSGHEHNYERFGPQDSNGKAEPQRGIREFVVGTGGRSHYPIRKPIANSKVYNDESYGVLKLTLNPKSMSGGSYLWRARLSRTQEATDATSERTAEKVANFAQSAFHAFG